MSKETAWFNARTMEVITISKTVETLDEALDYDVTQMQIFHKNLPMSRGNYDLVQEWIDLGHAVTSTPIYGPSQTCSMMSTSEFNLEASSVLIGNIMTRTGDVDLAAATVKRLDTYLRYGTFKATLYSSVLDYAQEIINDEISVRDPSSSVKQQVEEAAQTFSTSEDSMNCTWEEVSTMQHEDWLNTILKLVEDNGFGRHGRSRSIRRFIQHF